MKANSNSHWDWQAALLLMAAIVTAALRLGTTNWTPDLTYVELLALAGTVLGLALGYSRFQKRSLFWIVIAYTFVIVPGQLSWIITGEQTAIGQLASLGGRVAASFVLLFNAKAIDDPLFFVTIMTFLFWAIGIYSGYRLVRRPSILAVMLPSTLTILVIQYYDSYKAERIWGLAVFFFLGLMLVGRMNLLNAQQRWEQQNIVAGSDPEFDLNKYIIIAAAVVILMAWMLPTPAAALPAAAQAWKSLSQPFNGVRNRINDVLAALHGGTNLNTATELYGTVMSLGREAGNGTNEIFSVQVPQNTLPRLYWRMRTYDTYLNGLWQSSKSQTIPLGSNRGSLVRSDIAPAPSGEFTFTWQASRSSLLVTPSLPVWASRTGSLQASILKGTDLIDPLSWNAEPNIQTGDQYRVAALLLNPTVKELRSASDKYPQWIRDHYLQMPENISADFIGLANQITQGKATTFDKVEAVTTYLRQNIHYSETIPAAPPGMDPLSWFLFVWKSGFCNYYASAEVLLLRSLGIPARMVVGYSAGKFGAFGTYSVRAANAHAWPEIYFSGTGWVEFEPTVTQDVLVRPSGEAAAPGGNYNPSKPVLIDGLTERQRALQDAETQAGLSRNDQNTFLGMARETWLWVIISLLVATGIGFWGWKLHQRQSFTRRAPLAVQAIYIHYHLKNPGWLENWVRWSEVNAVERAFHAVNQSLTWLGKPQPGYATPAERAQLLKSLVPGVSQEIDKLSAALEQSKYSAHPEELANAAKIGWMIRFFTVRTIILSKIYTSQQSKR